MQLPSEDQASMRRGAQLAARDALCARSKGLGVNGAVIIDPTTGEVVGSSASCQDANS